MPRSCSIRRFSLLLVSLFVLGLASSVRPAPAGAAAVCQKRKKIRLRTGACKSRETTVADFGTDVTGIWQHRNGNGLSSGSLAPTFLTLNADGTGQLNRRDPATQVLSCLTLRYARGFGTPTLTLDLENATPEVVQAALTGADALSVTNDGGTSTFDRAASVDAASECGTLTEVSRLSNVPAPFGGSVGLAFNGTNFVYLDGSFSPVVVIANTGALGTPPTLVSLGRIPYAFEGADLWGLCSCGANDVAIRSTTTNTEVDRVDTADVGGTKTILSVTVPGPGQLFLLVRDGGGSTFKGRLLLVNTAGMPNTLISSVELDVALNSMGVDGARLFGLMGTGTAATVVRLDPTTGLATGTFRIPDATVSWRALTAFGGQLFLVGTAADGTGVIATFTAPS